MLKKTNFKSLIFWVAVPLLVGALSGFLTKSSMQNYQNFNKPVLSPPGIVFPVVWTILYILMGVSAYIIYNSNAAKKEKSEALFLFFLQLIINFFWSILFFNLNLIFISFLWIILLLAVVIFMVISFLKISSLAAFLQIPYILWLSFAAYLNLSIYLLNK